MVDSPLHVVPCTPQLRVWHSTPLSCMDHRLFYSADTPSTEVFVTGDRQSSVRGAVQSEARHNNSLSLQVTPIPHIQRRQRAQHQRNVFNRLANTPCSAIQSTFNTPVQRLKRDASYNFNTSASSVYQNQVVPSCTPAKSHSGHGDSRTKIKSKKKHNVTKSNSKHLLTCDEFVPRPYFTPDDEDIFLDNHTTSLAAADISLESRRDDTADIFDF